MDINTLKLGDVIAVAPFPKVNGLGIKEGTITYIHPKKRFFTVEFRINNTLVIRESYKPYGPLGCREENEGTGKPKRSAA